MFITHADARFQVIGSQPEPLTSFLHIAHQLTQNIINTKYYAAQIDSITELTALCL